MKYQWHSFTVTLGAKYLTGIITSIPPYGTFSLIQNNYLHHSKNYKKYFQNSNFWGMWSLGHVGHVAYSFIDMLFISTGIFDDRLRPHILSVCTTTNVASSKWFEMYSEGEGAIQVISRMISGLTSCPFWSYAPFYFSWKRMHSFPMDIIFVFWYITLLCYMSIIGYSM